MLNLMGMTKVQAVISLSETPCEDGKLTVEWNIIPAGTTMVKALGVLDDYFDKTISLDSVEGEVDLNG